LPFATQIDPIFSNTFPANKSAGVLIWLGNFGGVNFAYSSSLIVRLLGKQESRELGLDANAIVFY
jgi:hypothetical protein